MGGLPTLVVAFIKKAQTAVLRSGRGVVALILRDGSNETASYSYGKESQVVKSHWTESNLDAIQKAFLGGGKKLLIERIGADDTLDAALGRLKNKKWNYLAIPDLKEGEEETVAEWVKKQRKEGKGYKAVLPHCAADDEGIINFATNGIVVGKKTYAAAQYCGRIAGILAGTPLDNSCTYTVLEEVTAIEESVDPDKDVNEGKLILINDGEVIKIGRGVNSLTTLGDTKTEDMKKIKIIEGMDLTREDIRETWEENYVGKAGKYDNKILFINAVNMYFAALEKEGVLDGEYDNLAFINTDAQRVWLSQKDSQWAEKTEEEVKKANTGSRAFIGANVQYCDAMEDLDFAIYI